MIGGDFELKKARILTSTKDEDIILTKNNRNTKISFFSCFTILLNCAIGTDPMFVPYSFQCGALQTLLISFIIAILTQISFHIFVSCWRFGTEFGYIDIWKTTISKRTTYIPSILLIICYFVISASYSYEVWWEFENLLKNIFLNSLKILFSTWTI